MNMLVKFHQTTDSLAVTKRIDTTKDLRCHELEDYLNSASMPRFAQEAIPWQPRSVQPECLTTAKTWRLSLHLSPYPFPYPSRRLPPCPVRHRPQTDSAPPQVRPQLESIAVGLYELKIPRATHWVIFVPQECSATLLRDILARKRCPSAPSPKDHREILDSQHHQGTAIPRFGESAVPCCIYSTSKSFRHTCRLLSIITVCPKFYLLRIK